jgi:hypothetical protein
VSKYLRGYKYAHQRKDRRHEKPIQVKLDGTVYHTLDWSFGGVRIGEYEGGLQPDWETRVEAVGLETGPLVPINLLARVVWVKPMSKQIALAFDGLPERVYDVFEGLTMNRLRT